MHLQCLTNEVCIILSTCIIGLLYIYHKKLHNFFKICILKKQLVLYKRRTVAKLRPDEGEQNKLLISCSEISDREALKYIDWINEELANDKSCSTYIPIALDPPSLYKAASDGFLICRLLSKVSPLNAAIPSNDADKEDNIDRF